MKNIEIKTTQNVVLQYELADLRDRVMAFLIDFIVIIISISIVSLAGFSLFMVTGIFQTVMSILMISIFLFYSLAFEVLNNGQSPGKMAMRIQVIKINGGKAAFSDYAARWVFRMVDIYFSLGGIAAILIASSSKAQRIGDIVAHTAVVKLAPKMNLRLKDLLTIHSQESYSPAYPQARQLKEQEALLIKSALERWRAHKNEAHAEALDLLAQKIREELEVENGSDNKKFLQTVLKDYVVLTR